MAIDYSVLAQPKGKTRKQLKARKVRAQRKTTSEIRAYVFARDREICRCCRKRKADSLHELQSRGAGGKRSKRNSVAVCGSGTTWCHGFLQKYEIRYEFSVLALGAEDTIVFEPRTQLAADWMGIDLGTVLLSPPMIQMEQE